MLSPTQAWRAAYPNAAIGVLVMHNVTNPDQAEALDGPRAALEQTLRERFPDRAAIRAHPVIQAYAAYYKQFKKTYHVELQLASVAVKGRGISRAAALVEAMFMAELETLLLTAGHDLDLVVPPVRVDVADGSEHYTRINGEQQALKAGDMYIADAQGVLTSIIYGPDTRTQIGPETTNALFTIYAPAGIEVTTVEQHLAALSGYVTLVSPGAEVAVSEVVVATPDA